MLALSLVASAVVLTPGVSSAAVATPITVFPADPPDTGNCYPFGIGGGGGAWTPFAGFVYKNIPAFELHPGDTLAFDTDQVNNVDVQLDIALSRTTTNGGDVLAAPFFTTVVTNTHTPVNPRGDTIQGNFEMQFTAQAPFSFPGGGLLMRFSNASAAYATDVGCTGNLVAGKTSDSSGLFVERFFNDADGLDPWDITNTGDIGAFRITPQTPPKPGNAFSLGAITRNKKKGTATLTVNVPNPGELSGSGSGAKVASSSGRAVISKSVPAGSAQLLIKATGKKKRKLNDTGKVKLNVAITYTPTGGDPSTQSTKVKLKKKL